MKLPKTIRQWEELDSLAQQRIDEVTDLSAAFLTFAGYNADSLDENGDPITGDVQALLMDAMLRAPHLYLHISKLCELTTGPADEEDALAFDADGYSTWAHNASVSELRSARTTREATLANEFDPVAHAELQIIAAELLVRQGTKVNYEERWLNLPDHQREYGEHIWSSAFGTFDRPHSPLQWELMYRISSTMDGMLIEKYRTTIQQERKGN